MQSIPFSFEDVEGAQQKLRGVARRTPLVESLDMGFAGSLHLKTENLQLTHAFKFRGAYNRVTSLTSAERDRGLIAASSGNHALGLSLAGAITDSKVTVVMPEGAPEVKAAGCRAYGADVLRRGETYDDALAFATDLASEEGYTYVQSFDDPIVAAGQATATWEIVEDIPDLEVLVLPIGGGGLATGALGFLRTAPDQLFAERTAPLREVKVVGVQAEGAASMVASVGRGERLALSEISTIADGIAVKEPGRMTFEAVASTIDELVTVSDEEMLRAVALLATREKLVVEPAGAAAVAAVLGGRGETIGFASSKGSRVVCILSGGNLESDVLLDALQLEETEKEGECS
ncbi:MAG: threonine/serine dehydratase [Bacillota bacterium]